MIFLKGCDSYLAVKYIICFTNIQFTYTDFIYCQATSSSSYYLSLEFTNTNSHTVQSYHLMY